MVRSYDDRFAAIEPFRTVARDPKGLIEPARGLAPLLRSWLRPRLEAVLEEQAASALFDEFDKLLLRRVA